MFLGSELDRMFDEMLDSTAFPFGLMTAFAPALPRGKAVQEGFIQPRMNITGDEKAWHISVEIPGVEEKDIVVEMKENSLIISGEKKTGKRREERRKRTFTMWKEASVLSAGL
jgi:Molecular chaperone (small heat shock protein)